MELRLRCALWQFEDIHLLATERPHPQAWNFRRTDAELPVFGSGQCHLDGIVFLAQHLKRDLGFEKVRLSMTRTLDPNP